MLAKKATDLALHSKILTPRQRWLIVRKIKAYGQSNDDLIKIITVLEKEATYLDLLKEESDEEYESRLKKWVQKLQTMNRGLLMEEVSKQAESKSKKKSP